MISLVLRCGSWLELNDSFMLDDQGRPGIPKNCFELQSVWYSFTTKFGGDFLTLDDAFDAKEVTGHLDACCKVTDLPAKSIIDWLCVS